VGAELIELDVQLSRDGHPVVLHDATLERTTSGRGPVSALDLADLRELSAGYSARFGDAFASERVPTLYEALSFLKGRARALIEIKPEAVGDDAEGGVEALTLDVVRRAGMAGDVMLISFDRRALVRCRQLAPEIGRGHLFYRASADEILSGAREVATSLVMPEKALLSDELVGRCRAAGLRVATWVVDDPEELRALARFDLYAVGSNRPGVLIEESFEGE